MKKNLMIYILVLFTLLLCGCNNKKDMYTIEFDNVFSIVPYVKIECTNKFYKNNKDKIYKELSRKLKAIDAKFDVNKEDSMISTVNRNSGIDYITCDEEFAFVLERAVEVSSRTLVEGKTKYDVTIYPVWKEWDFNNNYYVLDNYHSAPSSESISSLLGLVNYHDILFNYNDIMLKNSGMMIDLGSIVKGYAADKVASYLLDYGISNAIIDVGGNIITLGKKEDSNFKVAITTPFSENIKDSEGYYIGYLEAINDMTVVTSGTYERYIMDSDGNMYHHILDPLTGYPIDNDLDSVSIVLDYHNNSIYADAYSTALFGMGSEEALKFANNNNMGLVLVTKSKEIIVSDKIKDIFTFNDVLSEYGYTIK